MTREEAIEYLDGMKIVIPICNELKELTDERNEAIDMAIEALQTLEAVERIRTEVLPQTEIDDKKVLEAINTIEIYMEQEGVFLATSMWRAKDGTILSNDWGYFEDGMKEIKEYIERREP